MDIVITDIYGNKLEKGDHKNNSLPLIIIHTRPNLLIKQIDKTNKDSVHKLVHSAIIHILRSNNILPENFASVGHIWLPTDHDDIQLLLINTNISKYPQRFYKVGRYNKFGIWKPVGPK